MPVDMQSKLGEAAIYWVMLPAGAITEQTVQALSGLMQADDCIIDGGNSYYRDDIRRRNAALDGWLVCRRRRHYGSGRLPAFHRLELRHRRRHHDQRGPVALSRWSLGLVRRDDIGGGLGPLGRHGVCRGHVHRDEFGGHGRLGSEHGRGPVDRDELGRVPVGRDLLGGGDCDRVGGRDDGRRGRGCGCWPGEHVGCWSRARRGQRERGRRRDPGRGWARALRGLRVRRW